MIQSFLDSATEDIYNGIRSKKAIKKLPTQLWKIVYRKFYFLENAVNLKDLRVPPSNYLERLKGSRKGQHSIRINDQYRMCFKWSHEGPINVEIVDYH